MSGFVQPWWERGSPALLGLQPCRDASPAHGCSEETLTSVHCSSSVDEATGEPVRHCVKLLKRYLRCAGRPETMQEEKEELTARGQDAQQPLVDLSSPAGAARLGSSASGSVGSGAASTAAAPLADVEDVGHALTAFLRFAEELQEEMVPGSLHLDEEPAAAPRPYVGADAEQQRQQAVGADGQPPQPPPFAWLGGLLFGKRRGGAAEGGGGGGGGSSGRRQVDPSTWREFSRDFTEV